jgi:hypothetical protein
MIKYGNDQSISKNESQHCPGASVYSLKFQMKEHVMLQESKGEKAFQTSKIQFLKLLLLLVTGVCAMKKLSSAQLIIEFKKQRGLLLKP